MKIKFYTMRIFSIFVVLTIMFTSNVSAYSNNLYSSKENYYDVKNYAENFMKKFNSKCKLNNPIELYNFQENKQALFFSSNNGGYIIINLDDYRITEFSPKNFNKFIVDRNKKYFYNGPLAYFEESNSDIIDCKTKEKVGTINDLKNITYPVKSSKNIFENLSVNLSSNDEIYTLKNKLPNYDYNADNRCTVTATTMLLAYYSQYWTNCNDYVSPYNLKHEEDFSNELLYCITGKNQVENGGISLSLVPDGINKYLTNYQHAANIMKFSYINYFDINNYRNLVKNIIQEDKPIILSLVGEKPYGNHTVTAWGYCNISNNEFFMINDGWGRNGGGDDFTYASPQYVTEIVY